jgi:site-specific recombinase XerD
MIAAAKGWLSLKIQISMETGLRPIEITGNKGLRARDIHPEQQTITATSVKGCNPRPPMKITANLLSRLQNYIQRRNLQASDLLFTSTSKTYSNSFRKFKKHLSKNLANPIYESIRLYDIRHYYITRKARKIQNAEIVRQIVGHKYLNTTQKYMHLAPNENLDYDVVTTKDQKQVDEYLAQDYTYVLTTPDGYMKFRRPK